MNRKPGDWNCTSCNHLNFSRRDSCQRCHEQRPPPASGANSSLGFGSGGGGSDVVRPGDWYCSCGTHNFASRSSCFKCSFPREDSAVGGDAPRTRARCAGWKFGDWICTRPGCNKHNFASRTECFGCNAPREPVAGKDT